MKSILCFGDSNTYGLVPGTAGRYDSSIRWTGILDLKLRDKGYRIVEEGLCGRTTVFQDPLRDNRRGVDMLPAILETHNPIDTIILMLGTNDCKTAYSSSPALIGKGIEKLIGQIRSKADKSKILLVSPIFLGKEIWKFDGEFDNNSIEISKQLPDTYCKLAKKNNTFYLRASDYAQASRTDREHLDEEGHKRLADAIFSYIGKTVIPT